MGLHINICCDFCREGQSLAFDGLEETYRDLIDAVRTAGWRVTLSEKHWVVEACCPSCPPTGPGRPDPSEVRGP